MDKKTNLMTSSNTDTINTVEVLQRRWLSDSAFEIELTRPPAFEFAPGQAIRLIHDSIDRYYSIISTPEDTTLTLCVYYVPRGILSPVLAQTAVGDVFSLTGPHGYFTFTPSIRTPVFVATGTGIAPFVSMGRSGLSEFILFHEVQLATDFYYRELFRALASSYTPCLAAPSSTEAPPPGIFHGRAADFIKDRLAPGVYDFYLCGYREMTSRVTLLVDDQFPGSNVFREVFY
ncbi:hypothetical protein D1AOALGA4SA_1841 [Olavius algarvensis Delta 1 endosymbiont]|nr:hypothetical protein D1AOALGA4SA_1841 [Olavius algarvensis Delta 1 endosymbiont]